MNDPASTCWYRGGRSRTNVGTRHSRRADAVGSWTRIRVTISWGADVGAPGSMDDSVLQVPASPRAAWGAWWRRFLYTWLDCACLAVRVSARELCGRHSRPGPAQITRAASHLCRPRRLGRHDHDVGTREKPTPRLAGAFTVARPWVLRAAHLGAFDAVEAGVSLGLGSPFFLPLWCPSWPRRMPNRCADCAQPCALARLGGPRW